MSQGWFQESPPTLVVGFKDNPEGRNALAHAVQLGARLGAAIHILHVIDLADYPIDPDTSDWEREAQRTVDAEEAEVRALMVDFPGIWTYSTSRGDPLSELRQAADLHDAAMVILGAHGDTPRASLARFLRRSLSQSLVRSLRRPVLVVPLTGPHQHSRDD